MRRRWLVIAVVLAAVGTLFFVSPALAQNGGEGGDGGAASESLLTYIRYGGLVGHFIILMSIVGLGLTIESFMSIRLETFCPTDLRRQIEMLFDEGEYEEVMTLCETQPTFLTNLLAAGLPMVGAGYDKVEDAMQEALDKEATRAFQKVSYLSLLAAQAVMWGLLGTVTGMISAFSVIAHSQQTPHPSELAGGIQQALVTTAEGLAVSIPLSAAFFIMRNRVVTILSTSAEIADELMSRFRDV